VWTRGRLVAQGTAGQTTRTGPCHRQRPAGDRLPQVSDASQMRHGRPVPSGAVADRIDGFNQPDCPDHPVGGMMNCAGRAAGYATPC